MAESELSQTKESLADEIKALRAILAEFKSENERLKQTINELNAPEYTDYKNRDDGR